MNLIKLLAYLTLFFSSLTFGLDNPANKADPHRNEIGFFDIHVCNWPDRPQFFFALFSSARFEEIAEIEVFRPDKTLVGKLDLNRFRLVKAQGKPEKRVFIKQFPTAKTDANGWYTSTVILKDGRRIEAKDYVKVQSLPYANLANILPANSSEKIDFPSELSWAPVAGARFYQVFITDLWNEGESFYTSDILKEPRLKLPPGLLKSGGMYAWRIHARDINEDRILGDFNSGSLGPVAKFTIK